MAQFKTIKELPAGFGGFNKLKVKSPSGEIGWWVSQWAKGVWIKKEKTDNQVYPIFVEDLKECLDWEIIEIDNEIEV